MQKLLFLFHLTLFYGQTRNQIINSTQLNSTTKNSSEIQANSIDLEIIIDLEHTSNGSTTATRNSSQYETSTQSTSTSATKDSSTKRYESQTTPYNLLGKTAAAVTTTQLYSKFKSDHFDQESFNSLNTSLGGHNLNRQMIYTNVFPITPFNFETDLLVYIHIQKTGGSTFGRSLINNLRTCVPYTGSLQVSSRHIISLFFT